MPDFANLKQLIPRKLQMLEKACKSRSQHVATDTALMILSETVWKVTFRRPWKTSRGTNGTQ